MIDPHEFTAAIPPQHSIQWEVRPSCCGAVPVSILARTAGEAVEVAAHGTKDGAGCWLVRPAGATSPEAWLEVELVELPRRYIAVDVHQAPASVVPEEVTP